METQDKRKGDNNLEDLHKQYIEVLKNLKPITDVEEVMATVNDYLKDLSSKKSTECSLAIGVFLRQFINMQKSVDGHQLNKDQIETMFIGETVLLDLNNDWYRSLKPILEPIIAESKVSLVTALHLQGRSDELKHDSDVDTIWSLVISSWDFIPWFIFMATGDMNKYMGAKEIFRRMIVMAKSEFLKG